MNALQPVERALQTILCRATDRRAGRFLAALEFCIEGAAHDARVSSFRVAQTTRFMDLVAAQSEVGRRRGNTVAAHNGFGTPIRCNLTTRLRGVIFIGEAPLGGSLNF